MLHAAPLPASRHAHDDVHCWSVALHGALGAARSSCGRPWRRQPTPDAAAQPACAVSCGSMPELGCRVAALLRPSRAHARDHIRPTECTPGPRTASGDEQHEVQLRIQNTRHCGRHGRYMALRHKEVGGSQGSTCRSTGGSQGSGCRRLCLARPLGGRRLLRHALVLVRLVVICTRAGCEMAVPASRRHAPRWHTSPSPPTPPHPTRARSRRCPADPPPTRIRSRARLGRALASFGRPAGRGSTSRRRRSPCRSSCRAGRHMVCMMLGVASSQNGRITPGVTLGARQSARPQHPPGGSVSPICLCSMSADSSCSPKGWSGDSSPVCRSTLPLLTSCSMAANMRDTSHRSLQARVTTCSPHDAPGGGGVQ